MNEHRGYYCKWCQDYRLIVPHYCKNFPTVHQGVVIKTDGGRKTTIKRSWVPCKLTKSGGIKPCTWNYYRIKGIQFGTAFYRPHYASRGAWLYGTCSSCGRGKELPKCMECGWWRESAADRALGK